MRVRVVIKPDAGGIGDIKYIIGIGKEHEVIRRQRSDVLPTISRCERVLEPPEGAYGMDEMGWMQRGWMKRDG